VEDSRHAVSDKVREQYKSIATGESTADEAVERKALEGDWYPNPPKRYARLFQLSFRSVRVSNGKPDLFRRSVRVDFGGYGVLSCHVRE
jgi:hypothetical protein